MTDQDRAIAEQITKQCFSGLAALQTLSDADRELVRDTMTFKIAAALAAQREAEMERSMIRRNKCLSEISRVLTDPNTCGINDTIWFNEHLTLLEFVEGCREENQNQQTLPIHQGAPAQRLVWSEKKPATAA